MKTSIITLFLAVSLILAGCAAGSGGSGESLPPVQAVLPSEASQNKADLDKIAQEVGDVDNNVAEVERKLGE